MNARSDTADIQMAVARQRLAQHLLKEGKHEKLAATINILDTKNGFWNCVKGFTYGLQFSPQSQGPCYKALATSVDSLDLMFQFFPEIYKPWVWGDILMSYQVFATKFATANSNCNFKKLLNNISQDLTISIPAMISRVSGAFINEIPVIWKNLESSANCFDGATQIGKLFSIGLNYYI